METTPQAIVLTPIAEGVAGQARYNHLERVPFHAATAVTSETPADCHLQIWELDYYQTQRFLQNEESNLGPRRNQLIATFPGVVVREGRRFRFRPTGDPLLASPAVDPLRGKVTVALRPVGRRTDRNCEIPLAGFETVFELAATLRTSLVNRDYERLGYIPTHQVRNVEASLRRQIAERGGFAIAFVAA